MTSSTTRMHEGAIVDVTIDAVDDEGRGRGLVTIPVRRRGLSPAERSAPDQSDFAKESGEQHDVAVRGAWPGDVVQARVDRVWPARNLSQARAVSFASRSSLHVQRTCAHVAPCPGCPFEGVDAGFALAFKRARVEQALIENGLPDAVQLVDDVVASRGPRQKAKLTVGGREGALRFGLFVPHSHHLVDTDECPHVRPEILDAIAVLADVLDDLEMSPATLDAKGLKAIVARAFLPPSGGYVVEQALRVGVVLVAGADVTDHEWRALTSCVDDVTIASLALRIDDSESNSLVGGRIARTFGPQMMRPIEGGPDASVDAFCQTDPALAVEMYQRAARFLVDAVDRSPGTGPGAAVDVAASTFVDAYAGAGGFARALVERGAAHVVAIERAEEGVRTLRTLENVEAIAASVEDALPSLQGRAFAGIVADPPKSGLRDVARGIATLGAPRIVLVACDPDAGARDAKRMVEAGYRVERIEPFDLFPATAEIETVFFFAR